MRANRLSHLSDLGGTLEEYDYLGSGTVVRRAHPQPGVDMTYIGSPGAGGDQYAGLDEFGRVVDLLWVETSGPTPLEHIQHSYDLLGNRLTRDNLANSAFDEVYAYDDLNQLVDFARGSDTQQWQFDALGNWNSVTTNGGTPETRTHNAQNQITGISGATTPAYDFNGNMTGDETGRSFVYDAWNRLVEVKSGSTTLVSYQYDGLNRRIVRDDGTDVTDLYYSDQWQVLEERVNGSVYAHYVWSPVYVDAMVLRDRSVGGGTLNERLWVIQDTNWNITALVNGSGNVVERYAYTPFGVRTVMDANYTVLGSSAYDFQHGFQGRPLDGVSGNMDNRGRWYRPSLGRPVTMDPIRYAAGDVNLYRWEGNGPVNFTDPFGLLKTGKTRDHTVYERKEARKGFFGAGILDFDNAILPKKVTHFYEDFSYEVTDTGCGCKVSIRYAYYYGKENDLKKLEEALNEGWTSLATGGWDVALKVALKYTGDNLKTYSALKVEFDTEFPTPCAKVTWEDLYDKTGAEALRKSYYDAKDKWNQLTDEQKTNALVAKAKYEVYLKVIAGVM